MVENDEDEEYLMHIPTAYRIMRNNQDKAPQAIVRLLQQEFSDKSKEWIAGLINAIRKAMK